VIVNRSGGTPLTPPEVLALRTYAAAGGSILVIASPMWNAAGAVADNALLSLFDIEAEVGSLGNARATEIEPHPITEGVTAFTAQQGAQLRARREHLLVRIGDRGLLAARDYGRGRVVAATIGQWHTPEILLVPEINDAPPRRFIARGPNTENYEYIRGLLPEPPLLLQAVRWLREPRDEDASFAEWRTDWRTAVESFAQAQARIMPPEDRIVEWTDLPQIFDRLVAGAPSAELKELSLWSAGECLLEKGHYNFAELPLGYKGQRGPLEWPKSGRRLWDYSLPVDRKPYQRLMKDFPDSPLHEYARYRLACAECLHKNPLDERNFDVDEVDLVRSLAKPFEQLDLRPGRSPHAWAKLDAGQLCYVIDDVETAARHYEEVVESMPVSAEKAVAVLNLAKCRVLLADNLAARRLFAQLDGLPNFDCSEGYDEFVANSYQTSRLLNDNARVDLRTISQYVSQSIDRLEQNQEFQKWQTDRKRRLAGKSK